MVFYLCGVRTRHLIQAERTGLLAMAFMLIGAGMVSFYIVFNALRLRTKIRFLPRSA
jgi:hypothetical protein